MRAGTFSELAAYTDGTLGSVRWGAAFPAAWTVINDRSKSGEELEKAILSWKNDVVRQLLDYREPITRVQRSNALLYQGKHYFSQEQFSSLPYNRNKKYSKNKAKIVLNYLGQAVDQHVADLTAYEPNLTTSPANDEESDRVMARQNRLILEHYKYIHKWNTTFQTFHRRKKIMGETFLFLEWDPDAGDVHPKARELRRIQREMGMDPDAPFPLVDPESGEEILDEKGNPIFITESIRTGDVVLQHEYSERVLYPTTEDYLWPPPWIVRLQFMDIDEARARWPGAAAKLKPHGDYSRWVTPARKSLTEKVCIRTLYHPPSRFLEKGYYCKSTHEAFLEGGDYPYDHNRLPCIRGTDIDIDFELTGMSFFQNLVSLNYALNNSTSMILQNQSLFANPKYAVPRGARVRYQDLGDDRGIYEYAGPKPPELMVNNSTPADTWRWRDALRDEFKTLSAIFGTSRGEAPDGITANVALRMIDEQERKFHKPAIDKHNDNVVALGELYLSTLGTYRDPEDGALISVLGKNNERYLRFFNASSLQVATIVHMARSSGLPDSPAAKTQTVLDIADRFEGLWTPDEILEYLDIQRPEKLIESATVARQAAESEVEDILSGIQNVPVPQAYHDILPKYGVYVKAAQSRAFDEALPDRKQRLISQIIAAEYLISTRMQNPAFAQQVFQRYPSFPMYFPVNKQPDEFALAEPMIPQGLSGAGMPLPGGAPPLGGVSPQEDMTGESPPSEQIAMPPNQLPSQTPPPAEPVPAADLP